MGGSPLGCVEQSLRSLFYSYGLWVGRRPLLFLLLPVVFTFITCAGLLRWTEENRVWNTYSPSNARSHEEHAVFRRFFDEEGTELMVAYVGVWAEDDGNLLREEYMEDVILLLDYIQGNVSVDVEGERYSFPDFCGRHCNDTDIVRAFARIYRDPALRASPNFRITWPMLHFMQDNFYVGRTLSGVETDAAGKIESVKAIVLQFPVTTYSQRDRKVFNAWELGLLAHSQVPATDRIRYAVLSDGIVSSEVRRNGNYITPYIGVALLVIFVFVLLSSLHKNPVKSKPWEAMFKVAGVICPTLAIVTTFGVLIGCGYPFIALYSVMPFLVLAIGVDDAFIIIHAWHKSHPHSTVQHRIAEALQDAGPSITMTSLTNAASFLIGATSSTPGIHGFCLFTAVAISIDYLYQVTFFVAAVVLGGEREFRGRNAYLICVQSRRVGQVEKGERPKLRSMPSTASARFAETWMCKFFTAYARVVTVRGVKAAVGVGLVAYWAVASFGFSTMAVVMSPEKTVLDDSPLIDYIHHIDRYLGESGGEVYFFVNRPPVFTRREEMRSFMGFLGELESFPFSLGANSTAIWLRSYLEHLSYVALNPMGEFYEHLWGWLDAHPHWRSFLKLNASAAQPIHSFYFTSGFKVSSTWR